MIVATALIVFTLTGLSHTLPQSVTELPHYTKLTGDEIRHLQSRGFGPTVASVEEEYDDHSVASSQQQRSVTYPDNYPYQNAIPIKQAKAQYRELPQQLQQQVLRPKNYPQQFRPTPESVRFQKEELEEKEEEVEEPDRLSLLLPQSKFACSDKNGYYADEGLGCEVFHYCQDNAKHSWICPEGFTFHQVHLICMPPGGDNICSKSSEYHFVNEYLYKPLNLEEHQQRPNISLKYSDRYYPDHYYQQHEEYDEEQVNQHRNSVRVRDPEVPKNLLVDQITRTTFRPETTVGQVFRSPNEVNIPLQQRRPQYITQRYLTNKK